MDSFKKIIISTLVICIFSLITFYLLLHFYRTQDIKEFDRTKCIKDTIKEIKSKLPDTLQVKTKAINSNRLLIINKSLDSINTLFIKEVSGTGPSKKQGYGPRALSIKLKVDSLKKDIDSLNKTLER